MKIYEFTNYKLFVKCWIEQQPSKGRGIYQKLSTTLRIHRTTISQIFNADKHLTLEQASELGEFLGFSETEALYLLTLVERDRAGSVHLKQRLDTLLVRLKEQGQQLHQRVAGDIELDEAARAHFYSDFRFSFIRVLCSLPSHQTLDSIVNATRLPKKTVIDTLDFLIQSGLCKQNSKGKYEPGPMTTYLPPNSPYINAHRKNWRLQAIESYPHLKVSDLAFSAPLTLSKKEFETYAEKFKKIIEDLYKAAGKSTPEVLAIFNIDWISRV